MIKIGNMLWRIGEILDFDQQLAWIRDAGFDGVGFHASAGIPGEWCGIEPCACSAGERKRLRKEIGRLAFAEIHAPFRIELRSETLSSDTTALMPILELAQNLGAGIVTVHALVSDSDVNSGLAGWLVPMQTLNAKAIQAETKVALEIVAGFDKVISWGLSNVGVNLDVGHMYLPANRQTLKDAGGIRNLIRHIGSALIHLHLHDVDGNTDHIEIGTGGVEFKEIAAALQDIGYQHNATLEMNPDRVSPEGILRSAENVRRCFREVRTG